MNYINLCPHEIRIRRQGQPDFILPPSGQVARCEEITSYTGAHDGIMFTTVSFGEVQSLPEQQPDTILIVSTLVRQSLPNRSDLASPGSPERDSKGRIIRVKYLITN